MTVDLTNTSKQLLDQIELMMDAKGLRLDFSAVNSTLAQKIATDPSQAATDLAEFMTFTTDSLVSSGWDGAAQLGELKNSNSTKPNKTWAYKRRRSATKSRAACACVCWSRVAKPTGKNFQIPKK